MHIQKSNLTRLRTAHRNYMQTNENVQYLQYQSDENNNFVRTLRSIDGTIIPKFMIVNNK